MGEPGKRTIGRPRLADGQGRSERVAFRLRAVDKMALEAASVAAGEPTLGAWLVAIGLRAARRKR